MRYAVGMKFCSCIFPIRRAATSNAFRPELIRKTGTFIYANASLKVAYLLLLAIIDENSSLAFLRLKWFNRMEFRSLLILCLHSFFSSSSQNSRFEKNDIERNKISLILKLKFLRASNGNVSHAGIRKSWTQIKLDDE